MTDAFIYDAVRTPRGRGKADGARRANVIVDECLRHDALLI